MARKRRKGLRGTRFPARGRCEVTPFATIRDVKQCAEHCGSHFFDPGALRFFDSRVSGDAYADRKGGAYFITSEQFRPSTGAAFKRRYTVRKYDPKKCGVDTVGSFQQYASGAQAKRVAKKLAERGGLGRGRKR